MNTQRVVYHHGLCTMVKTAQAGDLNARANIVSKLDACQPHKRELVQCHKMCLPDLQSIVKWLDCVKNSTHVSKNILHLHLVTSTGTYIVTSWSQRLRPKHDGLADRWGLTCHAYGRKFAIKYNVNEMKSM